MKQLQTLIKLHQGIVDQKRLALKALLDQEREAEAMKEQLLGEYEAEKAAAGQQMEQAVSFGYYAQTVRDRVEVLDEGLAEIGRRMQVARDELADAYKELKKYEITLERREAEERKTRAHKDQLEADDNTASRWRYARKSES